MFRDFEFVVWFKDVHCIDVCVMVFKVDVYVTLLAGTGFTVC